MQGKAHSFMLTACAAVTRILAGEVYLERQLCTQVITISTIDVITFTPNQLPPNEHSLHRIVKQVYLRNLTIFEFGSSLPGCCIQLQR